MNELFRRRCNCSRLMDDFQNLAENTTWEKLNASFLIQQTSNKWIEIRRVQRFERFQTADLELFRLSLHNFSRQCMNQPIWGHEHGTIRKATRTLHQSTLQETSEKIVNIKNTKEITDKSSCRVCLADWSCRQVQNIVAIVFDGREQICNTFLRPILFFFFFFFFFFDYKQAQNNFFFKYWSQTFPTYGKNIPGTSDLVIVPSTSLITIGVECFFFFLLNKTRTRFPSFLTSHKNNWQDKDWAPLNPVITLNTTFFPPTYALNESHTTSLPSCHLTWFGPGFNFNIFSCSDVGFNDLRSS